MRFQPWHIIVLVAVLILLFGAKRLPDAARSLGRSLRILKAETKGLADDDVNAKADAQAGHQPIPAVEDRPSPPPAQPVAQPVQPVAQPVQPVQPVAPPGERRRDQYT